MRKLCLYANALKKLGVKGRDMLMPDPPQLNTMNETVKGMLWTNPAMFNQTSYLRLHERADWAGAPPELIRFVSKFMTAARKRGFPLYVHTVYRSPILQAQLKNKGLSTLQNGAHQRSCAADIVHPEWHWDMPKDAWLYLGALGREVARANSIQIRWGGDWDGDGVSVLDDPTERFWDPAHWELKDWRDRPEVPDHEFPEVRVPYSRIT